MAVFLRGPVTALRHTFRSLNVRDYRFLWSSTLFQTAGQNMNTIAIGYYAYELTGSAAHLGGVVAAMGVPGLLVSLYGGALGDRLEKKTIIQVSQLFLALAALLIGVSISTETVTWGHLLVASSVYGTFMSFVWPVRQAIIPQTVTKELLLNASAINSMAMSIMTTIGPAIGGAIIALFGVASLFYTIGVLHVAAIILMVPIARYKGAPANKRLSILLEIVNGLRYVKANTIILLLLLLGLVQMTMMVPIRFVMPIFAKDVFGVGPDGLGMLMASMGIGSLAGALFVASLGAVERRGLILGLSGIFSGLLVLAFALTSRFLPLLALGTGLLFATGLIQSGRIAMQNSLILENVSAEYRGRVMSLSSMSWSLMPVGVFPLTILMAELGAPVALGIIAFVFVLISLAIVASSRQLRHLA